MEKGGAKLQESEEWVPKARGKGHPKHLCLICLICPVEQLLQFPYPQLWQAESHPRPLRMTVVAMPAEAFIRLTINEAEKQKTWEAAA